MKYIFLFITIISFCSCTSTNTKNEAPNDSSTSASIDTITSITPDFISLSEAALKEYHAANFKKWFRHDQQKLYYSIYTDLSITILLLTDGTLEDKDLQYLLQYDSINPTDTNSAINTASFVTEKGIQLGVSKAFVTTIYGEADSIHSDGNKDILYWNLQMKTSDPPTEMGDLQPIVMDGLGFGAEMTFVNDQLKTLKYSYEVP